MDHPAGTSSHCSKGPRRANLLSHFLCCKALNRFSIFSKILDVFSLFFFFCQKVMKVKGQKIKREFLLRDPIVFKVKNHK